MNKKEIDDSFWLGMGQTKAETKLVNAIMQYAKEQNVTITRQLCLPITTYTSRSASFYDTNRKEMLKKFEEIGSKFMEESAKDFIDSRLSDSIKLIQVQLRIERSYSVKFNPDNVRELKATPHAQFVVTITCDDTEEFFTLNNEKGE